ncbi:MAG: Molybdopterin molybdenumtransferase 2 [Gemmatimonadaceae bacterium]|nr:Molybdopterin molybdenumtransferase 2 [Gemmatimonadaceae bacterium]
MLSVSEASARILADVHPLAIERVPLIESAGRVLAQSAVARYTFPHWDNSAMDGYAVIGDDVDGATAERPVRLTVKETVAAGAFATTEVTRGSCTRIMTGAPLPAGADGVIRVEDTDGGTSIVTIRSDRDARRNLRPRGEDFVEGQTVIEAGVPITPAQIGVLASLGCPMVDVYRRPRVAIAGSGDELVDLDRFEEVLSGQRIVSSNSYTLSALVAANGGLPQLLGNAADSLESVRAILERAKGADLIVTSAGASVGEFDYTRSALESLGASIDFWRVRMRPGAPIGFGMLRGTPWLGLPGNPVSAMVTFELFVRPVIRRMLGFTRIFRRPLPVVLGETVTIGARLTHFLRAVVEMGPRGAATARLAGPQGSGILTSMTKANALLIVPEDRSRVEAGETLHALPISDDAYLHDQFAL